MKPGVDIQKLADKINLSKEALTRACKKAVDFGMEEINKGAAKNLNGPHYGYRKTASGGQEPDYPEGGGQRGKIPIPQLSGLLSNSLKMTRANDFLGIVYSDSSVANYNKYVHDGIPGTRRRPRRFLGDVARERRQAIINRWNYNIKLELKKASGG